MQTINVLGFGIIAGIATLIGVMLVFYREEWSRANSIYLLSFAAGIMLATALVHIIPESLKLNEKGAAIAILAGILGFYLLQTFMMFHSHEEGQEIHQIGILALIGLTFHSLLDGVAIVAGFEASYQVGVLTTLAVLLHELPEGVMTTGILLHSGMQKGKILTYSTLVAVATPIGAVVSHFALGGISKGVVGILLALAGGSFIYVAAVELIPETQKEQKLPNVAALIAGVLFITVISQIFGE
ncbi:MAG: ZIP family metal transporter [Candidatus Poribacteria bacterium]